MAKSRYRGKKKGRKSSGRKAAGKRLARYNKLAARIGKRAAHAQVFGGGKGRRGRPRRGGGRAHRVVIGSRRRRLESQALKLVKERFGTTGIRATPAEIRLAQIHVSRAYGLTDPRRHRPGGISTEERIRRSAADAIARTKRAAAARLVSIKMAQRAAEERAAKRRDAEDEARRAIEAEAARIG